MADDGLCCLPAEVLVHVLSFLTTAEDLLAVSMACRALASASRDDSLWRPLGHPSWEKDLASTEAGWRGAYMTWLRIAAHQYNGTGKTSIMSRYADDLFSELYIPTIGIDFKNRLTDLDGEAIREAVGGERFRSITSSYYRGAHGVLVTFDLTNHSTFALASAYLEEKQRYCVEKCIALLVGCKSDLYALRAVNAEEAMTLAKAYGVEYVECSAKTGEGVQEAIERLARQLAGDWRCVPGMETPNYVPAGDALFIAYTARFAPRHDPGLQQHKASKRRPPNCSLQ